MGCARCHARGLDVAAFLDQAGHAIAPAVPNGTDHLEFPYWYTLDPESQLITSDYGGEGCTMDTTAVMRWEYLDDDVNKYTDVLHNPRGVQTLHEATEGQPERSRIYREYMVPEGIAQEMLVDVRERSGPSWGVVRLNRRPGEPDFSPDELAFMAEAAPHIADGIRLGLLVGEATDPDLPDAPGLVVLDADGDVDSLSPGAERWLADLPGRPDAGPLPASVASVAAVALDGGGDRSTVRVRSEDGRWIAVHATVLRVDGTAKAAIIIEPAHRERIMPLLMAVYGLTAREQEVTRFVLKGSSTAEIASDLDISPQTVQQHLKSIFDKTGVRSRRDLVGKVFFENFDPRVQDNVERIRVHKPIRGGPLRRGT